MHPFVQRFLKDPLFQFLLIGALLFVAVSVVRGPELPETNAHRILVSEADILTFLQFKLGAFEPDKAKARLASLSPQERQTLIQDFVRNEVLVREAKGIGLSDNDAVIRQRLIQRMEFALESVVAPTDEPDEKTLQAYLDAHPDLFLAESSVTFTHVFYRDGTVPAEDEVLFRSNELSSGAALEMGDPFPYFDTYSERTARFVISHFGEAFTAELFDTHTPLGRWIGPLTSPHGSHWVYLSARQEARQPRLEEVRALVRDDYLREERDRAVEAAISALVKGYEVEIAPDLTQP
ncbi:MAG: peptidyl-prolyl cis-trans isomerase [Alphaproteobacteria bacterium]|nr:MAG: peptidyl-prolyl cis-trans isomerase [Alphaproteobacteria bacterium]